MIRRTNSGITFAFPRTPNSNTSLSKTGHLGDGTFHEGVNGLMQREDRAEVIQKLLFYQIPGGSGNCVASSLVYSSTGILIDSENLLINSMVLLTTGRRTEMGLSLIKQPDEADKYSFLLAFWGLCAKIDFESEKYRKTFGGQRFLISAIGNIANPPLFDGHIEVLEADKDDWRSIHGPILNVGCVNLRKGLLFHTKIFLDVKK